MSEEIKPQNPKKYYSLLELTKSIESVIKKTYNRSYWVKAEIAKLNYYSKSGHCYPDLVEKENGVVLAQIRATIWAGHFNEISSKFLKIAKEPLSDGISVLIRTSVSYHPVYGLGLHISDIEPSFTLGELAKEKMLSIEKLKSEDVFNKNKQIVPALLMQNIAVISVDTSKGYHDFIKIIDKNDWNYRFFHMLFPAILQGESAIGSITEQLRRIKKAQKHFDAVVVIRGGGGDIGLSSYDNYILAKAVATFPLPVITGIGHATNETVVEMVAFRNKITPTDVAYYLLQKFHNFSVRIQDAQNNLLEKSDEVIKTQNYKLQNIGFSLKQNCDRLLFDNRLILENKVGKIKSLATSFRNDYESRLYYVNQRLSSSIKKSINSNRIHITSLEDKVRILRPENILKRGYSITTHKGKLVTDVSKLNHDDIIETRFVKGKVKSKVQIKK